MTEQRLSPWPPTNPFPESLQISTPQGADFPESAGTREEGKFRPSKHPRLTQVAVVDDDGRPVTASLQEVLNELLLYQKAAVLGLSIMTGVDLLEEATG